MMSVFEYAMDVEKTVEEILKKCKELQIDATNEEDMLDEDAITELDNVLAQEPTEEDYDEIDEMEDELIEKEKTKIEEEQIMEEGSEKTIKGEAFLGKRVLLVEDNELNREIAKELLSDAGFYVEEAKDEFVKVSE